MLRDLDLDRAISKEEYKRDKNNLTIRLGELQRRAKEAGIPIAIVFEGWDAAGKGTFINEVLQALDPRVYKVNSILTPTEEEKLHPFMWRFWVKTPAKGKIAFFDRSWYRRVTTEKLENNLDFQHVEKDFKEIINFERQLADSGCVIIKFFLHISKKEQKQRFEALQKDEAAAWRVTEEDWKNHNKYNEFLAEYEEMIERTDMDYAPWVVVESQDKRFATIKIYKALIEVIESKLRNFEDAVALKNSIPEQAKEEVCKDIEESTLDKLTAITNTRSSVLDKVDLKAAVLETEEYKQRLKICQKRLRELEYEIYRKRIAVVVVYEGWDAAGKGGNIRRLVENLDPRGYEVVPIAAPNDEEKDHHYLWRFWREMPKDGHITIFDRSWYGRVMVERVENFCTETEWKRAYSEINEMEYQLTKHKVVLVKFWLHIDRDEQLKRFEDRQQRPEKNWKITSEDWRNRDKWDLYEDAVDEMLLKTSTTYAPWTIIESNDKPFARIKALETVIKAIEEKI